MSKLKLFYWLLPLAILVACIPKPVFSLTSSSSTAVPPVINEFGANPNTIGDGDSSNISWSVSNATSITIEPAIGFVAFLGNIEVSPSSTTTYTLTAINANITITTSITVVVTDSPPPAPPPTPPSSPVGASALCNDGTYTYYDHQCGCCSHHGGVKEWINKPPP
jgi:hypothetical protein